MIFVHLQVYLQCLVAKFQNPNETLNSFWYSDFEYEMKTVGEADGMIGKATAAIINNASSLASTASTPNGPVNINLVTAEGDVMARWMLPSLIDVAKANGTPIQNNVLGGG